ncbi:MAG: tetratricopeptide repeat protein [Bacteroidales bacterium]|nr:tetratricopeptide repeat protein [Bacteroidales bacterium]
MRKIYHFLFSCMLATMIGILPILAFSQDEGADSTMTHKEKRQQFDKYLFVNLNAGGMLNNTDIGNDKFIDAPDSWRFGFGGMFGWQFHPIWGVRGQVTTGKLYGERHREWWLPYDQVYYKAKIFDYHLDLTINFSNLISGYNPDRLLDIYGIVGIGQAQFKSEAYDGSNDVLIKRNGYGDDVTDLPGTADGFGDRTLTLEGNTGLGLAFHVAPKVDINIEYELKFLDTDRLDNFKNGTAPVYGDMYGYASVGLTYKFVGGDPLKKMEKEYNTVTWKAEPDPLEAHGGKVPIKITGTFPDGYFHPKAAMYAEPYLVCDGNKIPLKPILLKGTEVGGEGIIISQDGGTFTYETVVDYEESCRAAELYIEPVAFIPKEDLPADFNKESIQNYKNVQLPATKIADGTIITATRFAFNPTGAIVPHGYQKETILTKEAKIYFEVNKHNLNWNVPLNKLEDNKAKLAELIDFVALGYKIKDINVDGWASPEGEETFNQGLSENRSKTAQKYVADKIKGLIKAKDTKLTIKDAEKDIRYNLLHHGPDWNGFISNVQNSDIKDKNIILNVINSAGTPAKKEQEIRNMIVIYPEIEEKILPPLRRAEIVVNCYEPKKTDEEIIALSKSNPSALDEKELAYAGSLTKDKKAKLDIYKSMISVFPNNYKGYANAGAIEIEMGDLTAAKAHLEKAASLNPNSGEVHYNLGLVYALQGDNKKAEEHWNKASQLGTDANYNLGVLNIIKGEYSKAISLFGSKTCDYNVALAYIQSKNYPPAEKQLTCAPKDAQTHYLTAILGSRTGNTSMLFENLGKAIEMNSAYKAEAKIDREFIKYFADPNFTSLVNN